MNRKFKVGDEAVLVLPKTHEGIRGDMRMHDREVVTVSKAKTIYGPDSQGYSYYELYGIKSRKGIPYAFLPEWLVPIGEMI